MGIVAVVALLIVRATPDDDPAAVVARLGAARYADREAAADELRRMGRQALPALRAARSGNDPEIRFRALRLRDEIASAALLEPSTERLEAGQTTLPHVDAGPFRVELRNVVRERDIDLEPGLGHSGVWFGGAMPRPPGVRAVAQNGPRRLSAFNAMLEVSVKPGLRIVGEVVTTELKATDADGRSILLAGQARPMAPQNGASPFGWGLLQSSTTRSVRIALDDSTPTIASTARIEGLLTIAVLGTGDDPIEVPLANASGRTIERDGVNLTIHEVEVRPGQYNAELELTFETEASPETLLVQGPGVPPMAIPRPLDRLQREIEVIDEGGCPRTWQFLKLPTEAGLRGRMRLMIPSNVPGSPIDLSRVKLRVSTLVGAAMTFPFAFDRVPMP